MEDCVPEIERLINDGIGLKLLDETLFGLIALVALDAGLIVEPVVANIV